MGRLEHEVLSAGVVIVLYHSFVYSSSLSLEACGMVVIGGSSRPFRRLWLAMSQREMSAADMILQSRLYVSEVSTGRLEL